jgi:microcystin-dependent protein
VSEPSSASASPAPAPVSAAGAPPPQTKRQWFLVAFLLPLLLALIAQLAALLGALGKINATTEDNAKGLGLIGEVRAFAYGGECPLSWLKADGSPIPKKDYPDLYKTTKDSWGSPDQLNFNLPDLRGVFLRGWNDGRSDAYADSAASGSRVALKPRGATGDQVGSYQLDQSQEHTHLVTTNFNYKDDFACGDKCGALISPRAAQGVSGTAVLSAGSETRPKNASVMYCVKVR